ncbi:MAG: hypothetical protein R3F17_02160 [Planctomycetota bacterium]
MLLGLFAHAPLPLPQEATDTLPPLEACVPPDALMALHVADPGGLFAKRETSKVAAALTDPAWIDLLQSMSDDEGEEVDVAAHSERFAAMLPGLHGLVLWADMENLDESEFDDMSMNMVVRGEQENLEALEAWMREVGTLDEPDVRLITTPGQLRLCKLSKEELEAEDQEIAPLVFAYGIGSDRPGLLCQENMQAERNGQDIEFVANFGRLMEMADEGDEELPPSILKELQALRWVHMGVSVGEGMESVTSISVGLRPKGLLQSLVACLESGDEADLHKIPFGASDMTASKIDIGTMLEHIFQIAEEVEEGFSSDDFYDQLDMMKDQIGVDFREDVLENLTGSMLAFSLDLSLMSTESYLPGTQRVTYTMGLNSSQRMYRCPGNRDRHVCADDRDGTG